MVHFWLPTRAARTLGITKHYALQAEKSKVKFDRRIVKLRARRERDKGKVKVSRQAAIAEKSTQNKIIKATLNSGRRNKDGDHIHLGLITLDTKLQTTRQNPIIYLAELEKVREDAKRAGKLVGGLVIRNKNNVGCVVLREEDYVTITNSSYPGSGQSTSSISEISGEVGR